MWEQAMQVEALRLLSEWWDSSRRSQPPWGRRRSLTARGAPAADALAPTGDPAQDRPLGHGDHMVQDPAGNRVCAIYPKTPAWPQGTKAVTGPTPTRP